MAEYKVVDAEKLDIDLLSVADAIRTKGGTTESLEFPQGFVGAVGAIESGGGEVEGIIFLEFDEVYFHKPTSVKLNYYPTAIGEGTFSYMFANSNTNGTYVRLKEVYLPEGITWIPTSMFYRCYNLNTIHANFSGVEHIETSAFEDCKLLTEFPYLPSVTDIRPNAFKNCIGLTIVKFYSVLSVFASNNMFSGCTNITDIYVPWAEGEVANAPWGATNATIHYNTTYDENGNPTEVEV